MLPTQLVGGRPFFIGFGHVERPGAEIKQVLALIGGFDQGPPAGTDAKVYT
jgi:hypothetical protein